MDNFKLKLTIMVVVLALLNSGNGNVSAVSDGVEAGGRKILSICHNGRLRVPPGLPCHGDPPPKPFFVDNHP